MNKKLALLVGIWAIGVEAPAQQPNDCKAVTEIRRDVWPSNQKCDCSSGLGKKYEVKGVPGFSLVAVCEHHVEIHSSENRETSGSYYFRGNTIVAGEIKRNEYASGAQLSFVAPRQRPFDVPYNPFDTALTGMSFVEETAAFEAFKSPKLTDKVRCWKAPTKLKVTSLLVVLGSGDQQGNFPLHYQILDLGPYEICEPEA